MQSYRVITDTYLFNHEDGLLDQNPFRQNYVIDVLDDIDYAIQYEKDKLIRIYGDEEYPNHDSDLNDDIDELLERIESLDRPHSTTYVGPDRVVHIFISF
jgi:hypothetical protein